MTPMASRTYRVSEMYRTLQGEGVMSGTPVVLVRLQGCSVGCPWCDTKYSWPTEPGDDFAPETIARRARAAGPGLSWLLLTGGEPCEQAPLLPLIEAFHAMDFKVMLETSGTAPLDCPEAIEHLCCSPKGGMPGGKALVLEVLKAAHELKFVIGKAEDLELALALMDTFALPLSRLSLQPLGGPKKAGAADFCTRKAQELGLRVSLQTHKLLGLR